MLRQIQATAPALLVPAAWTVAAGAHEGFVSEHALLVAHVVMLVLQILFVTTAWSEMETGVLRRWRLVILLGIPATAAGLVGLAGPPVGGAETAPFLQAIALYGWMLLPGAGLYVTAGAVSNDPRPYLLGSALCAAGAGFYALGVAGAGPGNLGILLGLNAVGVGQTLGIVYAVLRG